MKDFEQSMEDKVIPEKDDTRPYRRSKWRYRDDTVSDELFGEDGKYKIVYDKKYDLLRDKHMAKNQRTGVYNVEVVWHPKIKHWVIKE